MDNLVANTQYNDMRGTVAADESDGQTLASCLRKQGRLSQNEHVAAVTFSHHSPSFVYVRVLAVNLEDWKQLSEAKQRGEIIHPPSLRKLALEIKTDQLFSFFKLFNVVLIEKTLGNAFQNIDIDNLEES